MSIQCTGTATGEFPADTAFLRILVSGRHVDPQQAYRTRLEAREVVLRVIADTTLVVREENVHENSWDGITHATWECEVAATGTFAGLQEVLSRLAAVPSVGVTGPYWRLSAAARQAARENLLAEAVRRARREAEIMIGALGGTLGSVRAIHSGQDSGAGPEPCMLAAEAGAGEHPPRTLEMDLVPETIPVSESVTVDFGIG
ncbi:MAG: SIMPL domain-containing protein [Corynebacterium sp.]|uniref:SIMPL domain-containing protein n=1 Tax=Corynebacterium sp. TaxID=1720 RepID=UPI0026E0DD9D|nr:SIMPL domain-containing protein [Corynebacterium sp.]MDO5669171.1 SIMPL domain-containing protein [Corynebacterium sp.]